MVSLKGWIVLLVFTMLFLFLLPYVVVNYYVSLVGLTDVFSEVAYSVAVRLGAEGTQRDGSAITLQNGKEVTVAFTCIDFVVIGLLALSTPAITLLVFLMKGYSLTFLGCIVVYVAAFILSVLTNIIRIAVTLYLANNYYATIVNPVGWGTFHDSVLAFTYFAYIVFWAAISYLATFLFS